MKQLGTSKINKRKVHKVEIIGHLHHARDDVTKRRKFKSHQYEFVLRIYLYS